MTAAEYERIKGQALAEYERKRKPDPANGTIA